MRISILLNDVKVFMQDKINRVFAAVILLIILTIGFYIRTEVKIEKVRKSVNFRYFNTTRSLEAIHNVKIDTKDGDLKQRN